jgi:hypothetical protein
MKDYIPTCPLCFHEHTLILLVGMQIKCTRDMGGCGQKFPIGKIAALYRNPKQ